MASHEFDWLNTSESADLLGITPRTLYRFIDEGRLPAYRFGRVIRLRADEVVKFIEDCRIAPGSLGILDADADTDTDAADAVEAADDDADATGRVPDTR